MNFDPKLWEGWEREEWYPELGGTLTRSFVDYEGRKMKVSVVFLFGETGWDVRLEHVGYNRSTFVVKETQEEALKVANAIGGWE